MSRQWPKDQIDLWCEQWARERKKVVGINLDSLQPHERLGRLSCTLGQVKEEGEGAAQGTFKQSFPEVYTGMALEVHRGFVIMRGAWRQVMDMQYVWCRFYTPKERCSILQISSVEYWGRLSKLKIYLAGFLQIDSETVIRAGRFKVPSVATIKSQEPLVQPLTTLAKGA